MQFFSIDNHIFINDLAYQFNYVYLVGEDKHDF